MSHFDRVFEEIIEHEGYYANYPSDRGGETYMGISRRYNPDWEGWPLIDDYKFRFGKIKNRAKLNIIGLEGMVKKRYKEGYWTKMHGDKISKYGIAANLFDFFIITEVGAAKAIQRALIRMGFNLKADGVIGPKTINAINMAPPAMLNKIFNEERVAHHNNEVIKNPEQVVFLAGWLGRVRKFDRLWT